MHKIFIILLSIVLTGVLVSQGISEETNLKDEGWKGYKLALVSKGRLKVRTTSQIMGRAHLKTPKGIKTYLTGRIQYGLTISLIDENKNGKYDDVGTDVMVLGNSSYGMPLSNILNIKNKLYHLKVATANHKIWMKPYEGATGKVDLISKYKSLIPVNLIILSSGKGDYFDVAKSRSFILPCGSYSLWLGYLDNGKGKHVAIKGGQMEPIEVEDKAERKMGTPTTRLKWGPPCRIDFDFTVKEEKPKKKRTNAKKAPNNRPKVKNLTVNIIYKNVKVLGSAHEEYFNFAPELILDVEVRTIKYKTVKNVKQIPHDAEEWETIPVIEDVEEKTVSEVGEIVNKGSFPCRG